jgi:hypothetical protein
MSLAYLDLHFAGPRTWEEAKSLVVPPRPQPLIKVKTISPHNLLSVSSTLLTIGLLVWAVVIGDGAATIAIVLLFCATTWFCAVALWNTPAKHIKSFESRVPGGDIVIRTRYRAFLVVKCNHKVARELYSGIEEIEQVITRGFDSCVGAGTVAFTVAVIMMGNCSWTMQAALALTYLLLNAVYWLRRSFPRRLIGSSHFTIAKT